MMTDKQMEEKKDFFESLYMLNDRMKIKDKHIYESVIWAMVNKIGVGVVENFIKILIENTEAIGDKNIRLAYFKGITRERLEELLEVHN